MVMIVFPLLHGFGKPPMDVYQPVLYPICRSNQKGVNQWVFVIATVLSRQDMMLFPQVSARLPPFNPLLYKKP